MKPIIFDKHCSHKSGVLICNINTPLVFGDLVIPAVFHRMASRIPIQVSLNVFTLKMYRTVT